MSFADTFRTVYGIEPDPIFVRMHQDGLLSYGTREEWRRTYQVRAITNPPALLLNPMVEWLEDRDLLAWSTPDYWRQDLTFVAFAHEGSGDDWCWVPNFMARALPVVYTPHDFTQAQVYAPDLESFLLRAFLEVLVEFPAARDLREIEANRRVLEPYVRPEWNRLMAETAARSPSPLGENAKSFISRQDLETLLREQFQFEGLNHTFKHMT